MSIEDYKLKVPYDKAGLSADGCEPTLRAFKIDVSNEIGRKNRPAVLICPGGAYVWVSEREADYVAMRYASFGIHAFVLKYSTYAKPFPTALLEAAEAMRFIRENSEKWDIDPNRISVCGFSAGGHLAASLAVHWNKDFVREPLSLKDEHKPNGLILGYPVISSEDSFTHAESMENIIGKEPAPEQKLLVSCEKQVNADMPPVFVWHCADDGCVDVMNTISLTAALCKNKIPFECHIYKRGGHGGSLHDDVTSSFDEQIIPENARWFGLSAEWIKSL